MNKLQNDKNIIKIKIVIFSFITGLIPLLGVYKSPIPGIDLGTVFILLFFAFNFSTRLYKSEITPIYLYVLILTPILLLSIAQDFALYFLRYAKFVVVLGIVFFLGMYEKFYNEEIVFKVIKVTIYLCSIFIIFQRLASGFGLYIQNPFAQFATYEGYSLSSTTINSQLFRPSGLFLEPSHFSYYGMIFLIYSLFKKRDYINAFIVTVAILCTGSGMGLICAICAWIAFIFMKSSNISFYKKLLLLTLLLVSFSVLSQIDFFKQVVLRFTSENINGGGNAINARISTGYQIFLEKNIINLLLGDGYGNVPSGIYLNGITYIINTLGLIGLTIYVIVLAKFFYKGIGWQKMGVIYFIAICVFAQMFNPSSLMFFFCILSCNHKDVSYNKSKRQDVLFETRE